MKAAGLAGIVGPVTTAGDDQVRDARLGGGSAKHGCQSLCLAFIDDQEIGMRQQPGGDFGIKGGSAVGKLQPTVARCSNKLRAPIGLVLEQRPVTVASLIKRGIRVIHVDIVIGAREQQDLVLAID